MADDPTLVERLEATLDDLADMVGQHCHREGDLYETGALSANRDAFARLVGEGRAEYVGEPFGRMATIRFLVPEEVP
jgi:hypothetical protein